MEIMVGFLNVLQPAFFRIKTQKRAELMQPKGTVVGTG